VAYLGFFKGGAGSNPPLEGRGKGGRGGIPTTTRGGATCMGGTGAGGSSSPPVGEA